MATTTSLGGDEPVGSQLPNAARLGAVGAVCDSCLVPVTVPAGKVLVIVKLAWKAVIAPTPRESMLVSVWGPIVKLPVSTNVPEYGPNADPCVVKLTVGVPAFSQGKLG